MSSYRMTPEIGDKMQEIIESIAKLPCAWPFLTPVNPDDDTTHTYYKKIKEPMDLSLIKMRLLLKKYQYVSDLQADMNLILKNSRTFNGPSHFITQLAEILIKNFEKMLYNIFPMTVRMWIEKVGELTWKIQNLFVNTKMPNFIESESIISATIKQAFEQHDSIMKQAMMSGKFSKTSIFKSVKSSNNTISSNTPNKITSFSNITENPQDQNNILCFSNDVEDHCTKPLANNSFVIPVIQPKPSSILKSTSFNVQSEDDFVKPSFIPSPIEPVFIPYPTNKINNSMQSTYLSDTNKNRNNNDEVIEYYMNHFYDYGFSNEIDGPQGKKNPRSNSQYSYREEEEDKSDDIFVQLDVLDLENYHFDDSDNELPQDYNPLPTNSLSYDGATQLLDQNDESNNQEQTLMPKSRQAKEKDVKERKPTLRKNQENDEFKLKEAKPRGRPKKIKTTTEEKDIPLEKDKEKPIDKTDKVKSKDKTKDKVKDKAKTKTKSKDKDKDKNDEKPVKTSKRIPKELKEKKEVKELKETKGRKFPKKVSHIRKTKSDSDFISENKTSQNNKISEDHIDLNQSNEKASISKRKAQTKRQNRKNLSADEADDDDFLPPSKSSSQSISSSNSKKRKNKGGKGRYKKFAYDDDDDYQYGGDNEDEWGNSAANSNSQEETLTDGQLIAFMEAAHQLNGPNDQKEMAAIIHITEPQFIFSGAYPVIDITKLKTVTLLALIKYTKKKFKERGKDYPIL